MSETTEAPIINDAITSDDAGFVSDAGDRPLADENAEAGSEETTEETVEASGEESEGVQAETEAELKEEIADAIEDGASEEEVKDMIREFTLKVNGQEKKVTIDLNNEDDLVRRLQLAEAGQGAMQKSRELEKLYEQEIKRLQDDPFSVLEELGLNPDDLAEARLRSKVEEMRKPEEQRQREQLERELQKARQELEERSKAEENARFEQLKQQEAYKIETEIERVLDAHTDLPKTPKTVQRIADAMLWALENGYEDVTAADVVPSVKDELERELNQFMSELPEEMMERYIGQKNLERYRNKRLSKAKTNNISNVKPVAESKKEEKKESKKAQRAKDYFKNL